MVLGVNQNAEDGLDLDYEGKVMHFIDLYGRDNVEKDIYSGKFDFIQTSSKTVENE